MKAKVTFEVDNCISCPFSEYHYQYHGISCSLSGYFKDYPEVPGWCPFILKQYISLIADICDSVSWREYTETKIGHIRSAVAYVDAFINKLTETDFDDFVYGGVYDSPERDKYLSIAAILLSDVEGKVRKKFLEDSGISMEDRVIVTDAVLYWPDEAGILKEFYDSKELAEANGYLPVLGTNLITRIVLYLADTYAETTDTDYAQHLKDFLYPARKKKIIRCFKKK